MHQSLLDFTYMNNFNQSVLFPTHEKGNILDLILANFDNVSVLTGDPSFSDHLIILFNIKTKFDITRNTSTPNPVPFWQFCKAKTEKFRNDCQTIEDSITTAIANRENINSIWSTLKLGILNIAHTSIPHF